MSEKDEKGLTLIGKSVWDNCIVPKWATKHVANWRRLPSCPDQTSWWSGWGWWRWWWWWRWGRRRAWPGPPSRVTTSLTTSSSPAHVTQIPHPPSRVTWHFSTLSSGIMSDSSDKRYLKSQQSLSCCINISRQYFLNILQCKYLKGPSVVKSAILSQCQYSEAERYRR